MESEASMAADKGDPGARLRRLMQRGFGCYAFDDARWLATLAPQESAREIDHLVLATAAVDPLPASAAPAERARALVADPAYQLK